MYPQAPGMNRPSQPVPSHLTTGLPPNVVQSIPGMPSSVISGGRSASTGFGHHQGLPTGPVPSGSMNMVTNQNKMWQQSQHQFFRPGDGFNQTASKQFQQQKDVKHRDYLKQQQRLKAMPLSSSKGMSADTLIGNLLDKKDTFVPKSGGPDRHTIDRPEGLGNASQVKQSVLANGGMAVGAPQDGLPSWLNPSSSRLPPIYSHIWSLVADPTSEGMLVDTNKILALLLTSCLPKEVLGFIWNLATSGANGQLNQLQLYITLALVALAQMGCTFNNLSVLNLIPSPPIPAFNMNVPKSGSEDKDKKIDAAGKTPLPLNSSISLSSPCSTGTPASSVGLSPHPVASPSHLSSQIVDDDDFADDFTDFQSAEIPSSQISSNLCSLPTTAVIQPSNAAKQVVNELNHSVVTKLGGSHGRSIGSRLANYALGAPKPSQSAKSHRPSIDNDNMFGNDELCSNIERNQYHLQDQKRNSKQRDDSENEDFSDFQIAAGLSVNVDELFPKCHPKTRNHDSILKESAIRNESDDEDFGKTKEEELLSLDSSTSKQVNVEIKSPPAQIEIPKVAPPPTTATKELMSIEEDKYSAFRFLELENTLPGSGAVSGTTKSADTDDFGDFVSADDLFAEIAVRSAAHPVPQTSLISSNAGLTQSLQTVEFPVDDWGTQDVFHNPKDIQQASIFDSEIVTEKKTVAGDVSAALAELDISKDINDPLSKIDSSSQWSFGFRIGNDSSSLNLNSDIKENNSLNDDDFGDFIGPDVTQIDDATSKAPPNFLADQLWSESTSNKGVPGILSDNRSVSSLELPGVTLSRHGSLPSLDLNLFAGSDDIVDRSWNSQVADWIRCLESSCSLLQAACFTFSNISSHSVLMEVLGTSEGRNYLSNLLEVHRVTWRIQRSYQRLGHESNQIDTIIASIWKVWSMLQSFYKLANIETAVEKDGSDEESGQPACGVCGSPASRGVLEYGGHVYHAPCANLWLNCVDRTLPAHSPLL